MSLLYEGNPVTGTMSIDRLATSNVDGGTTNFLRADGTWAVPPGTAVVPAAANPTGSIGLATVNGSAVTFMRSDGHPPLDQSITPVWTGGHQFQNAVTVVNAQLVVENTTSGSGSNVPFGVSNVNDSDLNIRISQVGAATKFATLSPSVNVPLRLGGDGTHTSAGIKGFGTTAAAYVDMTPDQSSWTTTISGPWVAGSNPSGTLKWVKQGNQVTIWADSDITATPTSVANAVCSGLPAIITPSSARFVMSAAMKNNGTGNLAGFASVSSFGIFIYVANVVGSNLQISALSTAGGIGGIGASWSISYSL